MPPSPDTAAVDRISVKGREVAVDGATVAGIPLIVTGRGVRTASIFDDTWRDPARPDNVAQFLTRLRESGVRADLFTFGTTLPDDGARFDFPSVTENYAIAPSGDFKAWWEDLPQESRKHVRKSQKLGVDVREVPFDDRLIAGLKGIYDESPVRQGRRFWHYGKPLETIRRENASYLDRSILIGAFAGEELIGFLKLVRVGRTAKIMQIVSKAAHLDKKTTNALLAKGVECCAAAGIGFLVYGNYLYGRNTGGQLTEFKRRNGFEMALVPRYYVPLTLRGELALAWNLHLGWRRFLPDRLERLLLSARGGYYRLREKTLDNRG